MKKLNRKWFKGPGPITVWSKGSAELIPERFRRLITVVMPLIYMLLIFFGITAALDPVPTFEVLVGTFYGTIWASLVGGSAFVSLVGLAFRLRIEIYAAIVLGALLTIYPFFIAYIVFHDSTHLDLSRLGVIFAVAIYPVMPGWRVIDIVLEIRKARQRQLYAMYSLGEAMPNARPTKLD